MVSSNGGVEVINVEMHYPQPSFKILSVSLKFPMDATSFAEIDYVIYMWLYGSLKLIPIEHKYYI